jgi:hypothetical protein
MTTETGIKNRLRQEWYNLSLSQNRRTQTLIHDTLNHIESLEKQLAEASKDAVRDFLADRATLHVNLLRMPYPRMDALHLAGATDYDAIKVDAERYRWLVYAGWFDDEIIRANGICEGIGDTVDAAVDAAMIKENQHG